MLVHRRVRSTVSATILCSLLAFSALLSKAADVNERGPTPSARSPKASVPAARDLILASHPGAEAIDEQIRKAQDRVRIQQGNGRRLLELGRLFISKARLTDDPGFYRLAEQCAAATDPTHPSYADSLLLRGHCLAAMHRFAAAEDLGLKLTGMREHFLDFGLLGDALMEQGKLAAAIDAYQKMADLKPSMPVYARVAHIRWLKGDLVGAIEAAEEAIESSHPKDAESLAWATNRLARYRWQEGREADALALAARALELVPSYGPALLTRGLIHLGRSEFAEAVTSLRTASRTHPLPEYQWALIEALRVAGEAAEAQDVVNLLEAKGEVEDPRSYALYAASTGTNVKRALELAETELRTRQDVFTYDAFAWALRAHGKLTEAAANMELAVREGTVDARLSLHAGVIFFEAGKPENAAPHLAAAHSLRRMLHPSEQRLLAEKQAALGTSFTP